MMEAIVLAGGFGTRLRSVVSDVPKPMAPIAGRPFLEILLDQLVRKGIGRAILSIGFMAMTIEKHFGTRYGNLEITYVVEDSPLGTGGALRLAMRQCSEDHVFVFNGDTYLDLEVDRLEEHWQRSRNPVIVGCQVSDVSRYGRMHIKNGRLIGFSEKGICGAGIINAGCYVLNSDLLDRFEPGVPFSLETDFFAPVLSAQPLDVFITGGTFIDIGVPEDYQRAQTLLAKL